jgi:carboxymethylenebutenolidase
MVASINGPMVMRDTAALLSHLDTLPPVKRSPMGALGYCMGGGYALAAAGAFPDRFVVAASFHGGALATEKPDSPHLLAPKMRARIYVGAAGIDPTFPDEQRHRLQTCSGRCRSELRYRDLRERQAWVCGEWPSRVRQRGIGAALEPARAAAARDIAVGRSGGNPHIAESRRHS